MASPNWQALPQPHSTNVDASSVTIVIVEGFSDKVALETLARRLDRDLEAEGISIVPIGGAHAIGNFLRLSADVGSAVNLAGLCDLGEESQFRVALERAGFGDNLTRAAMEKLGFFVCEADLEEELIRSLGVAGVEKVVEHLDQLRSFRRFQMEPAQQGRQLEQQLRRFIGTHSGRKALYARAMVEALDLRQVPHPLAGVLAHLAQDGQTRFPTVP
jgi:hypothetical protein